MEIGAGANEVSVTGVTIPVKVMTADTVVLPGSDDGGGGDPVDDDVVLGTLNVTLDPSSPSYALATAGSDNVLLGTLRFSATDEAIQLTNVALELGLEAYAGDLQLIRLYNGATQVGTAVFTVGSRNTIVTLATPVMIPRDGDVTLTVRGDLAEVGTSMSGRDGALIQVNYDGDDADGTRGVGQSSGQVIASASRIRSNKAQL